eukprot:GFYU01003244.1.p1 GENE.GFYU01003244.1~~GFYU01003244.1.p1  ORF type:complete len:331 (-),score=103.59 GFYU01003244.1:417-1409(-)
MKAVVCKEWGPLNQLKIDELPVPELDDHGVLIDVHSAGVNFPDVLIVQGKYQFKPERPFAPGGEVSGVVVSVGSRVKHVKAGDRVMASSGWGGYAEKVVVQGTNVLKIPDTMSYQTASGFMMTYGTSYHALKQRADIQPGETLLVLGATGGVGLAAVELGKAMGATVIAAGGSDEKLSVAKQFGATHTINYTTENLKEKAKELTGGKGVDVIYDPVGGKFFNDAIRSIAWKGRYLVVGFAAGDIPKLPVNLALLKGCQVVGVFWGAFTQREKKLNQKNFDDLFQLYAAGSLKPYVCRTFAFGEFLQALEYITQRKAVGKVIITVKPSAKL